jgi:serine/threonine-protein kinase TTK/MPS1
MASSYLEPKRSIDTSGPDSIPAFGTSRQQLAANAAVPSDRLQDLWENEDESFEIPDFHFDWGIKKDKVPQSISVNGISSSFSKLRLSQARQTSLSESTYGNPKPTPPAASTPQSAHSSASSARIAGLTDASTASASSLVPTPPSASFSHSARSISRSGDEAGSQAPIFGRQFQRVVSAPITRSRYESLEAPMVGDEADVSTSQGRVLN